MNYKEAGVDVKKGELFIDKIKPFIKETYNSNVVAGVGGFAALYDQGDHYLVTGTDGVGTKIKLAIELKNHKTIGEDLVAMCVNDILCTGATPLFFLDYLATSSLKIEEHKDVVYGIAQGCLKSQIALIGGETAEMPGMYTADDYDLAGFVVGQVAKKDYIKGDQVKAGMKIYALNSSGFHSNGYSLLRKLLEGESLELKKECLTPTRIYTHEVKKITQEFAIKGMAHITGGGLTNIQRIQPKLGYKITCLPELPNTMEKLITKAQMSKKDLFTTFNMGIGFVFICNPIEKKKLHTFDLLEIGEVTQDFSGVECLGTRL